MTIFYCTCHRDIFHVVVSLSSYPKFQAPPAHKEGGRSNYQGISMMLGRGMF